MLYLAIPIWMLVVVGTAWGVHRLWTGMMRPRVVNALLLPGTLVAQLGHVLGLLVTGARVTNSSLYGEGESGDPETTTQPQTRIPVLGPVIVGMLPLAACGIALYFTARYRGAGVLRGFDAVSTGPTLPASAAAFWDLLRNLITLAESVANSVVTSDFSDWRTGLFFYLWICLAVRTAPLPGNVRGSLAAIIVLGLAAAAAAHFVVSARPALEPAWVVLNLTLGVLLLLGMISLILRGILGLIAALRNG